MDSLQNIKQRFGIIGNNIGLNRALEKSLRVAETDISVLVVGESGVGKENIPRIIHQYSHRKHSKYIAVNCGAIPEGTIDSELFGHEKGAFTGATQSRDGYFQVADGGTIFLDEVGELPLSTQVRLLRVLESGEFLKVGSSKVQKSNLRIVAATNLNIPEAIQKGKFREDLYYRLSTVEILIPPLRNRKEDIPLLFRKFASDFAQKYKMPTLRLNENTERILTNYRWSGNIRQLRNVAEQLSVLEKNREISPELIKSYLPNSNSQLPAIFERETKGSDFSSEREILYKVLFDMKNDLNDLKKITHDLINDENIDSINKKNKAIIKKMYQENDEIKDEDFKNEKKSFEAVPLDTNNNNLKDKVEKDKYEYAETIVEEETLSLLEKEIEMIKRALSRSKGRRKLAAKELGISERTLYRKIKQFDLNKNINE
tara:strand:+ start:2534 stop:3820 length:1287 start_codon:yes stop_codon:yes gene_type:complete